MFDSMLATDIKVLKTFFTQMPGQAPLAPLEELQHPPPPPHTGPSHLHLLYLSSKVDGTSENIAKGTVSMAITQNLIICFLGIMDLNLKSF